MLQKVADLLKEQAFSVLAFSIFGMMFVMRPVTWLPTTILLFCLLGLLLSRQFRMSFSSAIQRNDLVWIVVPFVVWFIASLVVGFWHWGGAKHTFPENAFRIFLSLGALALIVHARSRDAFVMGLLVASVCAALNVWHGWTVPVEYYPRIKGTTNHPVHFGNFAALLMVLLVTIAALGTFYKTRTRWWLMMGASLALVAAVASYSRSVFLIFLCLLPVFVVAESDFLHRWFLRLIYSLALVFVFVVISTPSVQESLRIKAAVSDVEMMESSNYQGSMGSRLVMWRAAWSMFKAHPVVGVGPNKFREIFIQKMETAEVPRADAEHNQPHNDLLNAAATGGLIKLVAYLGIMIGPFVFFRKIFKSLHASTASRIWPLIGMQVVVAFVLTGLTNSNFDLQIYSTTYAVLVCVLAKLSVVSEAPTA
jgi:O-antigen ligase